MAVTPVSTIQEKLKAAQANLSAKGTSATGATGATGMGGLAPQAPRITGGLDPETGKATTDVSKIAADIAGKDSTIMQRARTAGLQQANSRGLLNSSMAVGAAQGEVIDQATAMASQLSDQRNQSNLSAQEASQEQDRIKLASKLEEEMKVRLTNMEIAANDRRAAESMVTSMFELYQEQLRSIMGNPEIGSSERADLIAAAGELVQRQLTMTESLHGIDLDWSSGNIAVKASPTTSKTSSSGSSSSSSTTKSPAPEQKYYSSVTGQWYSSASAKTNAERAARN